MDKGVLSPSPSGSGSGAREGEAVEASLSFAGDEGIHGGDDRREARAALTLARSFSASGRPAGQIWKMQLRTGRG